MSKDGFITEEDSSWQRDTLRVLLRFLNSLHVIKAVWPIFIITLIAAVALPQLLLWAMGQYVACGQIENCSASLGIADLALELDLNILFLLLVSAVLVRIGCWCVYEVGGQWSCQVIHARMVRALSRVKTTYFDENPSGRLINRLVGDFDAVRTNAVIRTGDALFAFLEIIANAILTAAVSIIAFLFVLPVICISVYIQRYLAPMLQRCNTIKSIRRGEVIHRETDIIEGGRIYALFEQDTALSKRLERSVRSFVQIHLLGGRIEAWGSFWLNTVATGYEFLAFVFVVYSVHTGYSSHIVAAVIVTAIFRLRDSFGWFNWITTYLIESLARARRLFQIEDLPEQTLDERKDTILTFEGVSSGASREMTGDIEFRDFSMSYRPSLPLIFNELNLRIPFAKHVGIFGRTGSGKSSIVQSLYRMIYVHGGDITIGGKSIYERGVEEVRRQFGMVPQDPYLFAGNLRSNLDRFGEFSDRALNEVLAVVGLQFPLDYKIEEGGRNMSQGERQLVCLARVLVSDKAYLIMDEPTSSIDTIADAKIQRVLREVLKTRTIITIAHRLETLNRHDWLIELSNGKVVREGTAAEVLAKT